MATEGLQLCYFSRDHYPRVQNRSCSFRKPSKYKQTEDKRGRKEEKKKKIKTA